MISYVFTKYEFNELIIVFFKKWKKQQHLSGFSLNNLNKNMIFVL